MLMDNIHLSDHNLEMANDKKKKKKKNPQTPQYRGELKLC